MKKVPDSFVEDRRLKSYPTEIGSQKFSPDDIQLFKLEKTSKLKHHFSSKFSELQSEYKKLIDEINTNERLYLAKHNFEPIPGKSYHLYIKENGEEFLSLISPKEWGDRFDYVGTFEFLSDGRWQIVN
jgi:sulfur carrier protein ThiS